jgi:hypothetical protein
MKLALPQSHLILTGLQPGAKPQHALLPFNGFRDSLEENALLPLSYLRGKPLNG